jgi:hypothetical protein
MLAWRRHSDRGIPVLGVASASASVAHKDEPLGRYHVLRIRREDGAVRVDCEVRGLAEAGGEVVRLSREDLVAPPF